MWAGLIQGVVLEQSSSLPLARTKVRVERIEGSQRLPMATVIAGSTGSFVVHGLPTGQYVLTATRAAYAPETYRSKPGDSRSAVLNLKDDGEIFAEVRMRRLAAITGRVVDENRVGIPGVNVIAYEAKVPLPGRYLVASSFDIVEVNHDAITAAKAQSIDLTPGAAAQRELTLWEPE